jgi:hypothetical protein
MELAKLLLDKGADADAIGIDTDGDRCTPLWWAARAVYYGSAGAADLVRLLVDNGADVNAVGTEAGGDECSPLWWAAMAVHCGEAGGLELATLLAGACTRSRYSSI